MKELNRIWEDTEKRLSSMDGDTDREYTIINNHIDRTVIGKITINSDDDEDQIIEKLTDEFPETFPPEKDLQVSGDGKDGTIYIEEFNPDGDNTKIAEMTTDEDIEDFDNFMENVLEITREQYHGRDGWITKAYTIIIGTGGPHIEFTTNYAINVYWAGKRIEDTTGDNGARRTIDRIEDYLNEIYTE